MHFRREPYILSHTTPSALTSLPVDSGASTLEVILRLQAFVMQVEQLVLQLDSEIPGYGVTVVSLVGVRLKQSLWDADMKTKQQNEI